MKTHLDGWNKYPVVYCQFFAGSAVEYRRWIVFLSTQRTTLAWLPSVSSASTSNSGRNYTLRRRHGGGANGKEAVPPTKWGVRTGGLTPLRNHGDDTLLPREKQNVQRRSKPVFVMTSQFPTSLDSLGCWIYRRLIFKRPLFISLWSTDEHWGLIYHFPSHSFIHDSGWHFERLHDYNPHPVSIFKPII